MFLNSQAAPERESIDRQFGQEVRSVVGSGHEFRRISKR